MTTPNDSRTTGTPSPGSRASDYASSKYYFPPVLPPGDDVDTDLVDAAMVDARTADAPTVDAYKVDAAMVDARTVDAGDPVGLPPDRPAGYAAADPAAYPPPDVPIGPVPRSRGRSRPVLGVALVLALLAGVLGGGYWMLHRHDDTVGASLAGPRTAVAAATSHTGSAAKKSTTYLFRPAKRHWTVRMPHRPTTRSKRNAYGAITGSEIAAVDEKSDAGLVWVRVNVEIPAIRQDAALRGGIAAFVKSTGRTEVSTRSTTFHGHLARVSALKSSSGKRYTSLAVVYQPNHVLFIVAPTGPTYNLIAGSFTWPV